MHGGPVLRTSPRLHCQTDMQSSAILMESPRAGQLERDPKADRDDDDGPREEQGRSRSSAAC